MREQKYEKINKFKKKKINLETKEHNKKDNELKWKLRKIKQARITDQIKKEKITQG